MNPFINPSLESLIHHIRGQKVMLDHDLARLYGVETKALNQAVKRHSMRFPADFCFQLTEIEAKFLRSQIVTSNIEMRSQFETALDGRGGARYRPHAFTELGIAMLSSVLRSEQAVQVNISIMRTFFKLRDLVREGQNSDEKIKELEKNTNELFKFVFERLDKIERKTPALSPTRRKIGI